MIDNAEKALWRDVKETDVLEAVSGSFLQTICTAFGKNYTPKAPLSLILMQGITLMSFQIVSMFRFRSNVYFYNISGRQRKHSIIKNQNVAGPLPFG